MSSVIIDVLDCPQCGLPATKDHYYVVEEERVTCQWCGYNHLKTIEGTIVHKGYGSIHYISKNANGSNQQSEKIVRLNSPLSMIQRHNTIVDIEQNYDVEQSSVYVWNDETNSIDCLLGKKPQTLEEAYQEQKQVAEYYRQIAYESSNIPGEDCTQF